MYFVGDSYECSSCHVSNFVISFIIKVMLIVEIIALFKRFICLGKLNYLLNYCFGLGHCLRRLINIFRSNLIYYGLLCLHLAKRIMALYELLEAFIINH